MDAERALSAARSTYLQDSSFVLKRSSAQTIGTDMSRLSVTETNDLVILSWLGLHAAFTKEGLPATWREAVIDPVSVAAVFDWLADFGSLDRPDETLPGEQLHLVLRPCSTLN